MKRILIVSPMPPLIGGISVSCQRLVDNLTADGYDVDVYNTKFASKVLNKWFFKLLKILLIPLYILLHRKYDIIHFHLTGVYRPYYVMLFKHLYKGAKIVFTKHGDVTPILRSPKCVWSMTQADKVICVQQGDAVKVNAVTGRDTAVDIQPFIMPRRIDESSVPHNVLSFACDSKDPLLIFSGVPIITGRWKDLYGFEDLAWLYSQLKREGYKFRLLIIVTGLNYNNDQRAFLDSIRRQIGADVNVMWETERQFPLMPLLKYATALLRLTKTDGDALSIREALTMHCNVVASAISVRPEGTLLYRTRQEMLDITKKVLTDDVPVLVSMPDNYRSIVKVYESF